MNRFSRRIVLFSLLDYTQAIFSIGGTEKIGRLTRVSQPNEVQQQTSCGSPPDHVLSPIMLTRGGDQELTLDQKVQEAMKKLGLTPPPDVEVSKEGAGTTSAECRDGICTVRAPASNEKTPDSPLLISEDEVDGAASRLAGSMNVDKSLAMAALSATSTSGDGGRLFDESAARSMIQQELDMIDQVPADSPEVDILTGEGFDRFLSRRALAFAEGNMDDARAILLADQEDEQEEEEARQKQEEATKKQNQKDIFPTVTVNSKIDPTSLPASTQPTKPSSTGQPFMPKPAKKSDVVFEATTAQIQQLVLESPVPVLLDIYADWCGPCKALTPALEEMAQKSGGIFRLVKVNTDNERPVSTALEVKALPTVFGVKDGKIIHMFQGMPRSEDAMKNFMMGLLVGESSFDPSLTSDQKEKYKELTTKLIKMAGAASFSFSARERLQDRIVTQLENLVEQVGNDASRAEESAKVVRSLLSNIINNPTETKYRTVKLSNAVMQAKVAPFPAARTLLKSVGFQEINDGDTAEVMMLGAGKKIVNVAPLTVARDSIDKWVDKSRYEIAKAARKRKDEEQRDRLLAEGAFDKEEDEDEDEDSEVVESIDTCLLKVRVAGKKKVYNLSLAATDRLSNVLQQLPGLGSDDSEIKITCAAKKLVVKSSNKRAMEEQTLAELGLTPAAALVVDVVQDTSTTEVSTEDKSSQSKLSERVAKQKKKKVGSNTMQSVGIYSKDDNNKAELIDGGGGVWYEHDVSDDEEEPEKDATEEAGVNKAEEEVSGDDESS